MSDKKFNFLKQRKFLKAFTLIELIIIVAVIIILGLIAYTQLEQRGPARGRDAKRVAELNTLRNALQLYYIDHGRFPTSTDTEDDWCYIEETNPSDPHYCPYLRQGTGTGLHQGPTQGPSLSKTRRIKNIHLPLYIHLLRSRLHSPH